MNISKEDRAMYNLHRNRVCEDLGLTVNQYNYIRRIGNDMHKLFEDNCNGLFEENEYETLFILFNRKLVKYLEDQKISLNIYIQSDPRGGTVYLSKDKMDDSNYNYGHLVY